MANQRILVIEDNQLNMKLLRGVLRIGRYRMVEAPDAETGIQLARQDPPDLILMDIQLPGMDGLSATRIIKTDPQLKDIPVFALTGLAMQGDEAQALQAGCAAYLAKPIEIHKLLEMLEQFFSTAG